VKLASTPNQRAQYKIHPSNCLAQRSGILQCDLHSRVMFRITTAQLSLSRFCVAVGCERGDWIVALTRPGFDEQHARRECTPNRDVSSTRGSTMNAPATRFFLDRPRWNGRAARRSAAQGPQRAHALGIAATPARNSDGGPAVALRRCEDALKSRRRNASESRGPTWGARAKLAQSNQPSCAGPSRWRRIGANFAEGSVARILRRVALEAEGRRPARHLKTEQDRTNRARVHAEPRVVPGEKANSLAKLVQSNKLMLSSTTCLGMQSNSSHAIIDRLPKAMVGTSAAGS